MYLTSYNLADYLLSKGLIDAESLVDGDFVLVETGRRNRNFKVLRNRAPGLFVKQIKTSDAGATSTIQREAAFYSIMKASPNLEALAEFIPSLVYYDPSRYALVLTLFPGGESLAESQLRSAEFPDDTAQALGNALGSYHLLGAEMGRNPQAQQVFPRQSPWIMGIDQPGQLAGLAQMGGVGASLAGALQMYPTLIQSIGSLSAEWQFDSLIHGDMKWDNCMLADMPDGSRKLRIVDWELADLGDGAWDVATIFKEYLAAWIYSTRMPGDTAPSLIPREIPIASLQPSIRAFWKAYAAARGLTGEAEREYLSRSIRFGAVRLIVAVLEYNNGLPQMNRQGYAMVKAGYDILTDPEKAQRDLLGIPQTAYATAN